jgi:hypothetical protein
VEAPGGIDPIGIRCACSRFGESSNGFHRLGSSSWEIFAQGMCRVGGFDLSRLGPTNAAFTFYQINLYSADSVSILGMRWPRRIHTPRSHAKAIGVGWDGNAAGQQALIDGCLIHPQTARLDSPAAEKSRKPCSCQVCMGEGRVLAI